MRLPTIPKTNTASDTATAILRALLIRPAPYFCCTVTTCDAGVTCAAWLPTDTANRRLIRGGGIKHKKENGPNAFVRYVEAKGRKKARGYS
jgi:hypothetical protein